MHYGRTAKAAHRQNNWCCFQNCPNEDKYDDEAKLIRKYAYSINKNNIKNKVSLSKRRALTCNLAGQKKIDTSFQSQKPTNMNTPINSKFDQKIFTPHQKISEIRPYFANNFETSHHQNTNNASFFQTVKNRPSNVSSKLMDTSFNSNNLVEPNTKVYKTQNPSIKREQQKISISNFKKINFTYKTNKLMQPQIIPYSEFIQKSDYPKNEKKRSFHIEKTVDLQFSKKFNEINQGKNTQQKTSYTSLRLNKQPSKPITLNYSSFQQQKSRQLTPQELSINIHKEDQQLIDSRKKNDPFKSMQMTNLPTDRCMNSYHDSLKNSGQNIRNKIHNLTEGSISKETHKLSDSSNIAYSIQGSEGSSGRQSVIVDMVPQQPLSPHIMKIKSQRASKSSYVNKSKPFCLSEIKL